MTKDLQKIPAGWKKVKLGEIIIENNKSPFKVEDADNNGRYPFFTSGEAVLTHSDYLIDGENLFLSTGGTAYVSYYRGRAAYSADTYAVKSKISIEYLYYFLSKQIYKITYRYFIGSGLEHLQKDFFKKDFEILVPESLDEQEKISEILETVDNAIEKTDKIIEKYKRMKQGLMQELLTKGIDSNWQIRSEKTHQFKDSPLGRIPADWEVKKLGEETIINPEQIRYEKNKLISYIDIESISEGNIRDFKTFKIEEAPSRAQRIVRTNDVIVSTVRPNLKAFAFITPDYNEFVCSTGFAVLRVKKALNALFLFYLTFNDQIFLKQVLPLIVGSNYPAVNSYELLNVVVPLPPLPEQERIASVLSQVDAVIEKETAYRDKLSRIKQGLMEDLLTGKVRVTALLENINNQYQKEAL